MRSLLVVVLSVSAGLVATPGCDGGGDGDADSDTDIDVDGDADGDADGDLDADADADADGDAGADGDADADSDGAPPCVDPTDPELTENERLLIELPADSWYTVPGTRLLDLCSGVSTYGDGIYLTSGCAMIVAAWGGGAYDSRRDRMIVWGGGHADYGGNEVYAFDLRTMTWLQLTEPSPPPFGQDPLADGNPVSRHTYDGVEYLAHRDALLGWGGARSPDGNGTDLTWELDLDSLVWTNRAPGPPRYSSPYDFGLAYDPVSGDVLLHSHAQLSRYDPEANTWTSLMDFGYPPWTGVFDSWTTRTGAVDPVRRHFVTAGGGARLLVYDIDAGEVLSLEGPWSAVTGGEDVLARPAPGIDFDAAASQLVAWSGGAPIALDADAHAWTALSAEGAPPAQTGNGTYGRWRYAARYNVFILVNDAAGDVAFYKHTALCGR